MWSSVVLLINMRYVFTGLSSDVSDGTESKKGQAWTLVLVIGIVVGVLALGAFIFLNRRNRRDFSHRKLVEEMSPDPGNIKLTCHYLHHFEPRSMWINVKGFYEHNTESFFHCDALIHIIFFKVLRLDNSEPLDLKFDGFGYDNPGLQRDNIQMTNFPQGRSKWEQICDAKDILLNIAPMWRQNDVIKNSLSF